MKIASYLKPLMLMLAAAGLMAAGTAFAAEHGGEAVESDSGMSDQSTQSAEHPGDKASHQDMDSEMAKDEMSKDMSHGEDMEQQSQEHPGS